MKVLFATLLALLVVVTPASAEWGRARVIANDATRQQEPKLAMNAHGAALIGFHARYDLRVARRSASGRLGPTQTLESRFEYAYDIALSDDGRAFAAWLRADPEDDLTYHVMFAEAPPGGAFGEPREIELLWGGWPEEMNVDLAGEHVVIAYNERSKISIATRAPGHEFVLRHYDFTYAEAGMAVGRDGHAVVTWLGHVDPKRQSGPEAVIGVWVRDGVPGRRRVIARIDRGGHLRTGLAPRGRLLATWQLSLERYYMDEERSYGSIRGLAAGAPGRRLREIDVERARRSAREGPQMPELAMARGASAVVAWQRVLRPKQVRHALRGRIEVARLSRGARRSGRQVISSATAVSTDPRVAVDGRGRATVVWQQVPPESFSRPLRLMAATAPPGRRFGAPRPVAAADRHLERHALAAGGRNVLLVSTRRAGRYTASVVVRGTR